MPPHRACTPKATTEPVVTTPHATNSKTLRAANCELRTCELRGTCEVASLRSYEATKLVSEKICIKGWQRTYEGSLLVNSLISSTILSSFDLSTIITNVRSSLRPK